MTPAGDRLEFTADHEGRLDRLVSSASGESRSLVQQWIAGGAVRVNGVVVQKAGERVRAGDRIMAEPQPRLPLRAVPEDIPVDVVYEDEDLLVVDKPVGLTVHPAPGHPQGTLVNALLGRGVSLAPAPGTPFRPGIVHRLDKDTSGLLVIAKSERAYEGLARQFRQHTILRRYLALAHGAMPAVRGTLVGAIGRDSIHRQRLAVVPDEQGKAAVTHYEVVESWPPQYALLRLRLETGRTHQIRVHLAADGHPLVSDPVYCPPRLLADDRQRFAFVGQALHAAELGFQHPANGQLMKFRSPLPATFQAAVAQLRRELGGYDG